MNLFHSPSFTELSALISQYSDNNTEFYLGVEHDGEVLMETDSIKALRMLRRFKFYMRGLGGKMLQGTSNDNNKNFTYKLYKNLLFCWKKNMKGAVDYDKFSNTQNLALWHELKIFSNIIADEVAGLNLNDSLDHGVCEKRQLRQKSNPFQFNLGHIALTETEN